MIRDSSIRPSVPLTLGALRADHGVNWSLNRDLGRIALVLALFLTQGLWLTICFDAGSIADSSAAWGQLFRVAPMLPRIGITFLILIPLFCGVRPLRNHAAAFVQSARTHRAWWRWWLGQWTAYAVLTAASFPIFEGTTTSPPWGALLVLVWLISAAATCVCCLFALAPPIFWQRFVIAEWSRLLAALVLSLSATSFSRLTQWLWTPLGDSTFSLVEFWLHLIYADSIVSNPDLRTLGTQSFNVHIAPQCSGYEGIGLISVFVVAFLLLFRRTLRFPHALLLLPIGVISIWICNSIRIAALIVIGTEYSANLALGGFHSQAGWILFNLVALGLMGCALRLRFFIKTSAAPVPAQTRDISQDAQYLVPFLALTAFNMLVAALVEDVTVLYPLGVIVSLVALWSSRNILGRLVWMISLPSLLCGVGVYLLWMGLAWLDQQSHAKGSTTLMDFDSVSGRIWLLFRVFGAVISVPLIEELAFRGFLARRLVTSDFETLHYRDVPLWAVVVSSVAFGLLHQLWFAGILAGVAYALVTRYRGRLTDAIYAHAITNGLLAVTVMFTGASWLW